MAQNYRQSPGRNEYGRGGRDHYRTGSGSDRDRYRTGNEQRYSPDWDDRNESQGFEGNRSYAGGGYSEEFGYRRGERDREQRGSFGEHGRGDYRQSGPGQSGQGQSAYGRPRYEEGRFDEANRWSEGASRDDLDDQYQRDQGTTTSSWHEDQGDRGSYFGTGTYIDDGGASRGLGRDFERARAQTQQRYGRSGTSGDFSSYGRSEYGAQSGYGRGSWEPEREERPSRSSSSYAERSGWGYGDDPSRANRGLRAGSGSSGGAYGPDAGYRSDYGSYAGSQSFRGRGPQGYQRSDERLKEMICERLTDDPAIDASNITVDVTDQVVKLTGNVEDRSTKYEVEELIERLGGVKDIDNQLRVQSSKWNQSSSTQQLRGGSDWGSSAGNAASSTSTSSGRSTSGSTSSTTTGSNPTKRN